MFNRIEAILEIQYNNLIKTQDLFGVFAVNGRNTDIYKDYFDKIDIYAVIIPNFENLYYNEKLPPTETTELGNIYYIDIRNFDTTEIILNNHKIINPKYEYYFTEVTDKFNIDISKLDEITKKIVKMTIAEELNQVTISIDNYINSLTLTEKKAYEFIKSEIGNEGTVSISKMIEKSNISRPVFTNLFKKMKEYDVAEITNSGVKGMYIKITHPELRN